MSDLSSFLSTRNDKWSDKLWDGLIEAIGARLAPLEENLGIQREVADAIIARGLTVIEQELAPIVAQAGDILDETSAEVTAKLARFESKVTGGTVLTTSASPATLITDATINLIIDAPDREFFAITPHIALSRASTTANWAIGKVLSYTRSSGALSLKIEQVFGAGGPYSDWVITSLPAATLLQKTFYEQTVALRGQVADDKSDTGTARDVAVAAVGAAQDARDAAILAAGAAEDALDDLRIAVAPPVTSPTAPVLGQIWYDGTTMRVFDGDDFVLVAPWNALTAVSYEVQSLSAPQRAQARANTDSTNAGLFIKASPGLPVFIKTGAATLSVKAGTLVEVDGNLITFATDTAITMPALSAGADVAIWVQPDGEIVATLNHIAPPVAGARKIGGAHYAPGGNAAAFNSGGNTTPQFNEHSIWDLKFRPACPDPRGMTLVAGKFWVDIYLCGVNHHSDGTSKYNVTIADGSSPPKVPPMFGGNGSTAYSTMNWWEAAEVMMSHGKELLSYEEFAAAMFGTKEAQSGGTDPVSTILRADYTSKWGVHLATGNMWVWSREFSYRTDATGWAWEAVTGGRGSVYKQGTYGLVAARLGGAWGYAAFAGSRASSWDYYPWNSNGDIGARGRCDHLSHV